MSRQSSLRFFPQNSLIPVHVLVVEFDHGNSRGPRGNEEFDVRNAFSRSTCFMLDRSPLENVFLFHRSCGDPRG